MDRQDPEPSQRLSGVDASFFYLERKETPLHMAGVFVFDGPISFEQFIRRVDSKLHLVPKYRQIVTAPPYNIGYPVWQDDPHFNIRRHIRRVRAEAPGGQAQLEDLAGRILTPLMDRGKPLWDMYVVEGLADGRGAVIVRIHHAIADGIAGAALVAKLILEATPEESLAVLKPPPRTRRPAAKSSLLGALANGIATSVEHLIGAGASLFELQRALKDPGTLAGATDLLPELVGAVERLPFNKPCSGERKFCWAEFSLPEIQAIRAAAGGSINDVVLTVLTRAIARYVELHGQTVERRLIRVVCPVNTRQDNGQSTGNQIRFMPVVLPMDRKDPVRMLREVALRTAVMKKARAADVVTLAANCLGIAPASVQAMLWHGISNVILPVPLLNMVCSNLPGSPVPLYCVGRRLLEFHAQVPTGYELGINCAVMSYCDKLSFGLIADAQAAPDASRLRDLLYPCFDELRRAAGVRKAPRRSAAGKARPAKAKAAEAVAAAAAARTRLPRRAKQAAKPVAPIAAEPRAKAAPEPAPAVRKPRRRRAKPAEAAAVPRATHAAAAMAAGAGG